MKSNCKPTFQEIKLIYQNIFNVNRQQKQIFTNNKQSDHSTQPSRSGEQQQYSDGLDEAINDKQYEQGQQFQDFQYDLHDFNDGSNEELEDDEDFSICSKDNSQQNKARMRRRQKDRKIRTTITIQRLQQMNKVFKEYQQQKDKGKNPSTNLKQIGHKLQLGYSTILHKFRQFRQNKVVKGGALLESLQKKRKYGKSKDVEKYIQKSLRQRPFYTAVELSKYIFRRFQKSYSRSIISRHLTEMGYSFNNIKPFPLEKNSAKYIEARKMFVKIIETYVQEDTDFFFIDQVAFSKNLFSRYFANFINSAEQKKSIQAQSDFVSVLISANSHKMYYYQIKTGFLEKADVCQAIKQTKKMIDLQKKYSMGTLKNRVLLTDIHKIHYDQANTPKQISISKVLRQANIRRFFLPPGSPQLNPLESIFSTIRERLSKQGICSQEMLREKLMHLMTNIFKQPTHVYFKQFKLWMEKAKYGENF